MADRFTIEIIGLAEAKARLTALAGAPKVKVALAAALKQEAEAILTVAQVRTPVDQGFLRASAHAQTPDVRGNGVSILFGFGGPTAGYALYVHENLQARHRVGRAKFLESAALDWQHTGGPERIKAAFDDYVASLGK